jgi:hypothetical protein
MGYCLSLKSQSPLFGSSNVALPRASRSIGAWMRLSTARTRPIPCVSTSASKAFSSSGGNVNQGDPLYISHISDPSRFLRRLVRLVRAAFLRRFLACVDQLGRIKAVRKPPTLRGATDRPVQPIERRA